MTSSIPSRPVASTQWGNVKLVGRCVTVRIPMELIETYREEAIARSSGVPGNTQRRRDHEHFS